MELLDASLFFTSTILGYIFKGLLALIVVAIVGVNLVPMLVVGFSLLREDRSRVKGQNVPIHPYLVSPDEQHLPES